jgi:hypothetical protein
MDFIKDNTPNAGKLLSSLRSTGYSSYSAISDLVDNSLDAQAQNIWITIKTVQKEIEIEIADDGFGMDIHILDEALKLGSLTEKDQNSDLGKYGMGLITASLSMCRRIDVLTKREDEKVLHSIQDLDEVTRQNKFVKYLAEADPANKALFDEKLPNAKAGTIIRLTKIDHIQNRDISNFAGRLAKELGRIDRYYINAGKNLYINAKKIEAIDPLMLETPETEVWSDDMYDIYIPEKNLSEKIRVRIAILPSYSKELSDKIGINIPNQGFYVLRNNREIASAVSLDVYTKHNLLNRLRMELFFPASLDEDMGLNYSKQEVHPTQRILDTLKQEVGGQIKSVRKKLDAQKASTESEQIDHSDAEKVIAQKIKLLITPSAKIEKRQSPQKEHNHKEDITTEEKEKREREPKKTQLSPAGLGCKFEHLALGPHANLYECEQVGKVIVIQWNTDHPFYKRMILENRENKDILNPIDYLVYAFASAELKNINDENEQIIQNIRSIMSANLRTLLT